MSFAELANTKIGDYSLGNIFNAVVCLLICLLAIRIITRLTHRLLGRSKLDTRVQKYIVTALKLLLYLITILIVMDSLGIPVTSLVALVSVAGLAFSLAAQDLLSNVAGGLVILSSRPFNLGDFIESDGVCGTVGEVTLNYTKLHTPDGQEVLMPNRALSSSKITNYTKLGRRRISHKIAASYDAPTQTVKSACRKALQQTDKLLDAPAQEVYLFAYGDSAIEYVVYAWCRPGDYWETQFRLLENIRAAFDEAGVEMTYNHLNVHIVENPAAPAGKIDG